MDLNVLNRVTPIKMERIDSHDLSFCSEADSSYFSLNEWENNGTRGDRGALHPSPGAGSLGVSPVSSSPVRKSLFAGVDEGINRSDGDSNSLCRNLNAAMQNDEGLQDDSFPNIWKSISIDRNDLTVSDPIFAFSETEGPLENQISLEVLSTIEDFPTFSNSQSTVATTEVSALANQQHSQLPCHNANVAALNQENENTYQCSPSYGNGAIMRSYSNDLPQHNATTLPNLVVSSAQQPGLVQHPNHHGMVTYQSTSPHNGEGPNSTHSSPYTPSPTGGYEYPTSPPSAKPSIPSNTDYPGDYNFQINFGEATVSAPKSAQYTYSHSLNKLFVKMNVTCPIKFKCDRPAPINCIIRAVPVFKRPEHVTDVATRCPNHKIPDEVNYNLQSSHLIRAEMPNDTQVRYEVAPQDGRESVSVFYERPQVGAEFTTILYKFMCLSSCVGGINRRPLLTVFTLEYDGQVLGRRVVEVRICSCPGRDRSQEEKKQRYTSPHHQNGPVDGSSKRPFKNLQGTMEILQTVPSNKKRRLTQANGDQEEFTLKIRGREKYEMLKRLKEALDLMDYVGTDQVAAYRRQEEEHAKLFKMEPQIPMKEFPRKPAMSSSSF